MAKKVKTERKVESVNRSYELMLILNPELRESEVKKKLQEIVDMIEKSGGKVTNEDFWGKRNMAYRIQKNYEGIYMVYNIILPSQFLKEFKNHLRIEKDVLRSMMISLPEGYEYVKYDIEKMAEEKPKREKRDSKKNISIKHNAPIIEPKKKEEVKEEKKEEIKKEAEEKAEEAKEEVKEEAEEKVEKKSESKDSDLDKKLDKILEGEDLKL